jgi:hypothetical protein
MRESCELFVPSIGFDENGSTSAPLGAGFDTSLGLDGPASVFALGMGMTLDE